MIKDIIDKNKHLILKAAHPSPLSAYNGFFGCNHFVRCNNYLKAVKKTPIDWNTNLNAKELNLNKTKIFETIKFDI